MKGDTSILTYARDGSKNVRAEINSAGTVTAAFRYRAYGELAQATTPSPSYLGLASQLIDASASTTCAHAGTTQPSDCP